MSITPVPTFPFLILFAAISIAAMACLIKFRSLRNFRKKRNIAVYAIVLLLLGLIGYQVYDWSLGSPLITNRVSLTNNKFQAEKIIELSMTSQNLCNRELTFNLTVSGVNASLTMGNQEDYVQVDSSTIKIPFHFNRGSIDSDQIKTVLFTINKDCTGFKIDLSSPVTTTGGQCRVEGSWDATTSSYTVWTVQAPALA
jgi:hypothetical protein